MDESEPWDIVPGRRSGPIDLGSPVASLSSSLGLSRTESESDGTDRWSWYESAAGDVALHTCNDVVVGVICERTTCRLRGQPVVGMSEKESRILFADQDVVRSGEAGIDERLVIGALGLELWISDGRIDSVVLSVDPDRVLEQGSE